MSVLKKTSGLLRLTKAILATCGFNLMVIIIIVALLTMMEQGAPLIVDMLASPGNLILFWFIIWGTALAYGHYPIYAFKWKKTHNTFTESNHPGRTSWQMNKPTFAGLGFITYTDPTKDTPGYVPQSDSQIKFNRAFHSFRGLLGLAFILAILYCLVFSYQKFLGTDRHSLWFSGTFIVLIGLYFMIQKGEHWKELAMKALKVSFALFLIMICVNLYLATVSDHWNSGIFWSFSIALTLLAIIYILFKKYRTSMDSDKFLFADHVRYLILIAGLGWISFGTVLASQFYPAAFNPVVILLAYFNILYGIYVIVLKHRLYYFHQALIRNKKKNQDADSFTSTFFRLIAPLLLIVLAGWIILAGIFGNNLHQLELVPDPTTMSLNEFRDHFKKQINTRDTAHQDTLYFIASYGGGLKANAWNLMVMDKLSDKGILESTIAISGVSGGNMGQFLYGGLHGFSSSDRHDKINDISGYNFLSRDLAWLMGWDFVRELDIFSSSFRPDRAKKSLEVYQKKVGDASMEKLGMRTYWKSVYDRNGHYPILISNAAGVNNRRGICCSVKFPVDGTTFGRTFAGAVNLLERKNRDNQSISYLGAASTSNRFPFLSPAAKVPEKGYFVDGGYFENSGMFSLLNFYEALKKDTTWADIFHDRPISFIQISNHKSTFIRQTVQDSLINIEKTAEAGEIFQVLSTKASTEFLPYYFEQKVQMMDNLILGRVNLPYKFSLKDIRKQYHGRTLSTESKTELQKIILANDRYIDSLYADAGYSYWAAIEPATARLLSAPAVNYMKMVLEHNPELISY